MHVPLIIAHRGDSSEALENSLEAVTSALAKHVDMIEIDVRKSRDNVLYVMHDKLTGRTAERNVDIEETSSREISRITLRNGKPIPSLEQVLDIVKGKVGLNIEIKSTGAGVVAAQTLVETGYSGYVLVSSFNEAEVSAARTIVRNLPVSVIYDSFSLHHVARYANDGYQFLSIRKNSATRELIDACHANGIQVYVWTVDQEEEMWKFVNLDVDGIYSNCPGLLKKIVEQHLSSGL